VGWKNAKGGRLVGMLGFALVGLGGLGVEAAGWALLAWPVGGSLPIFFYFKNCFLFFILLFLFKTILNMFYIGK
jgi:hypothetical protein